MLLYGLSESLLLYRSDLLAHLTSAPDLSAMPDNLPVHIMLGERDPCHENFTAVSQIYAAFKHHGLYLGFGCFSSTHVCCIIAGKAGPKLTVYGGARHEIFNETNREEVTEDFMKWVAKVLAEGGTSAARSRL
jgi:alpha-beta hydrolase superfamily lysophospholipase